MVNDILREMHVIYLNAQDIDDILLVVPLCFVFTAGSRLIKPKGHCGPTIDG